MSIPKVSEVVWPWRQQARDPRHEAGRRRQHVLIEVGIMVAVGLLFRFVFHKVWIPRIVFSLAAFVLISGLFIPAWYAGFKRGGAILGTAAGVGCAWLVLVPFFYICFTIGRVMLLIKKSDPLQRALVKEQSSYWSVHRPPKGPESYKKQY